MANDILLPIENQPVVFSEESAAVQLSTEVHISGQPEFVGRSENEHDFITFIAASNGESLTKSYVRHTNGDSLDVSPYPMVSLLDSYRYQMPKDVKEFARLIAENAERGRALLTSNLSEELRNKSRKGMHAKHDLKWLCIDIDGAPHATIESFIAEIPALKDVSFVVQYSASQGVKAGLRAHLFYLLGKASSRTDLTTLLSAFNSELPNLRTSLDLNETKRALKKSVDGAGVRPGAIIYIAPPRFIGMDDPVKQRIEVVEGSKPFLDIDAFPETWLDSHLVSSKLRDILNDKRDQAGLEPVGLSRSSSLNLSELKLLSRVPSESDFRIEVMGVSEGLVRCNINGGDSGAYYFRADSFLIADDAEVFHNERMKNFKGEPEFVIAEFAPQFAKAWNEMLLARSPTETPPAWLEDVLTENRAEQEAYKKYDDEAIFLASIKRFGSRGIGFSGVDHTQTLDVLSARHANVVSRIRGEPIEPETADDVKEKLAPSLGLLRSIVHDAIADGMHYSQAYGLLKFWSESIFFAIKVPYMNNHQSFLILCESCAKKLIQADRLPTGIFDHLGVNYGSSTKGGVSVQIYKGMKVTLSIENLIKYLDLRGMRFRYNLLTRRGECSIDGAETWAEIDDAQKGVIYSVLNRVGFPVDGTLKAMFPSIIAQSEYNPILERIVEGHKRWLAAGKPDILSELIKTIEVDPKDSKYRDMVMFRWFIQGVAKSCADENSKPITGVGVLTLHGRQGLNKSRWCESLVPAEDWRLVQTSVKIGSGNKDEDLAATRYFISELGELDGITSKAAAADIKAFLSKAKDTIRLPYGSMDKEYRRRTNFVATVNADQFLIDETGNRRFWVLSPTRVNADHGLDVWMAWGQAYALWNNGRGERHWLNDDENRMIAEMTRQYTVVNESIEGRLLNIYDFDSQQAKWGHKQSFDEICIALGYEQSWFTQAANQRQIRSAVRALGVKTIKVSKTFYYMPPIRERSSIDIPLI